MAWMLAIQFRRCQRWQTMCPYASRRVRDEAEQNLLRLPGLKVRTWRETSEEQDAREQRQAEDALTSGETHL